MIGDDELCNSFSACLTDECGCGKEHKVFYCADNSGCISLQQVSFDFKLVLEKFIYFHNFFFQISSGIWALAQRRKPNSRN